MKIVEYFENWKCVMINKSVRAQRRQKVREVAERSETTERTETCLSRQLIIDEMHHVGIMHCERSLKDAEHTHSENNADV